MTTQPATTQDRQQDRETLRSMLNEVQTSINSRDFDSALKLFHSDALLICQNGEIGVGQDGLKALVDKYFKQKSPFIRSYKIDADVSQPARFQGDTAVAHGIVSDQMELMTGKKLGLKGFWSTTCQLSDGQWKIRSLHFSTNALDNSILNTFKKLAWLAIPIGLVVGALLCYALIQTL